MNKIKTSTGRRGIQVYNSVMANLERKFRFFFVIFPKKRISYLSKLNTLKDLKITFSPAGHD